MYISQSKAAKLAGVSRPTIKQRIDDGFLSKQPEGIDVSDLRRLYTHITDEDIELIKLPASRRKNMAKAAAAGNGNMTETEKVLQKNTEHLQQLLEDNREDHAKEIERIERDLADSKQREEEWKQQFKQAQALLPAPEQKPEAPQKLTRLKGIFEATFGKGVAAIEAPTKAERV